MTEILEIIEEIKNQIEQALWTLEVHNELEEALEIYLDAESKLAGLNLTTGNPDYPEHQRVLSYCLIRQGNVLRQMKKPEEAIAISERELIAARASGNEVMLARSLLSNGTNHIVAGNVEEGLTLTKEAYDLFADGDSRDHQQGVGWYWILQADLANAGIVKKEPSEIVAIADRILEILKPIENWPGVARAYAARASAHEKLGNKDKAAKDRGEQQYYACKIELKDRAD